MCAEGFTKPSCLNNKTEVAPERPGVDEEAVPIAAEGREIERGMRGRGGMRGTEARETRRREREREGERGRRGVKAREGEREGGGESRGGGESSCTQSRLTPPLLAG